MIIRFDFLAPYAKTVAAVGAALGVVAAALSDGAIDAAEVTAIASAVAGVGAVYRVRNRP